MRKKITKQIIIHQNNYFYVIISFKQLKRLVLPQDTFNFKQILKNSKNKKKIGKFIRNKNFKYNLKS